MSVGAHPEKIYPITWEQLRRDARALAWKLLERGTFHGIIAVTRGGLVPAAVIARELGIRRVESLSLPPDDTEGQLEACSKLTSFATDGRGWLVIDDLADEGHTAAEIRRLLPAACLAVLYVKPRGKSLVDVFITEVSRDTWVTFPWDAEPRRSGDCCGNP